MAESTPYRESSPAALVIPLRSDPPWLRLGLVAVTLASIALFVFYFRLLPVPRPHPALALLPGLTMATFAGATLAWWGRRRGATLHLEASGPRLVLREPTQRALLLDRGRPFGAMLVADAAGGSRVLVLSQDQDPLMLLDVSRAGAPSERWAARTITVDLSTVALSPATAQVLTLAEGQALSPLLSTLEDDLLDDAPLLSYPLPSGETLVVTREGMRIGNRELRFGEGTTARRIAIETPYGEATGLSIVGPDASFLIACQDAGAAPSEEGPASAAPDAWVPTVLFAAISSLMGAAPVAASAVRRPYRG
jgi:hypothetical protein